VPLAEYMEHEIVRYEQIGDLKDRLIAHLSPYTKPVHDNTEREGGGR
jgi:hypothetical protein